MRHEICTPVDDDPVGLLPHTVDDIGQAAYMAFRSHTAITGDRVYLFRQGDVPVEPVYKVGTPGFKDDRYLIPFFLQRPGDGVKAADPVAAADKEDTSECIDYRLVSQRPDACEDLVAGLEAR